MIVARESVSFGKKMKVLLYITLFVGLFISLSPASASSLMPKQPAMPQPKKNLVVGTSADMPPFEYYHFHNGTMTIQGYDIDVARLIAQRLGRSLVIEEMDFSALIPALVTQRVDFVIASMTPTPQRAQQIDYTRSYLKLPVAVLYHRARALPAAGDLNHKTLAVQLGSSHEQMAHTHLLQRFSALKIVAMNRLVDMVEELEAGRIDGALMEVKTAEAFQQRHHDLEVALLEDRTADFAIALSKGSPLTTQFNRVLAELEADGVLAALKEKWFQQSAQAQNQEAPPGTQASLDEPPSVGDQHDENSARSAGSPALPRFNFNVVFERFPFLLGGALVTLKYTILSVFLGLGIGVMLALMRLSNSTILGWISRAYISIFRGTPLLVQLSMIYFGAPQLLGVPIGAFEAGVMAFSLNSAAYVAEIVRSGIQSIDLGQTEAAQSLGLSYPDQVRFIILPLAVRNILPALVNEIVNLLKESAIISIIAENDLLRRANIISAETYLFFEPLLVVALIYYLLVLAFSMMAETLEKRLQRS